MLNQSDFGFNYFKGQLCSKFLEINTNKCK